MSSEIFLKKFFLLTKFSKECKVLFDHHLHIFYQHFRRHDGNEYRGQTENYHSLGLSLKHGFLPNSKANQVNVSGNHMLYNNFNYEIELSYIVAQQNYPYSFIITPIWHYIFGHWSTGNIVCGH